MLNDYLVELADKLDAQGKKEAANAVDDVIQAGSLSKLAQYVGVIGYALKQNRAMSNCIRKKRVSSKAPMQSVVLDCLKEYQDGQSYDDNEWASKYAQVVQQRPNLFDATVSFLTQISLANDMDAHLKRVIALDEALEKCASRDEQISSTLDNYLILRDMLARDALANKEVGNHNQPPFKVAAPASPRGWWQRLLRPTDSWWRDTSRGRNDDARFEMDQILDNLIQLTDITGQARLQISYLRQQILGSITPVDPKLKQLVTDLSPDNWRDASRIISEIERYVGQLPFETANYLRNIHQQMQTVYQRLQNIQRLMTNLRQRDAVLGWGDDTLAAPTEDWEALYAVMSKLYNDPLDEEYLYYARQMHSRLDERLKGKPSRSGIREWFIYLRNQGMTQDQILQAISQRMGVSQDEARQLLSENLTLFDPKNAPQGTASQGHTAPQAPQAPTSRHNLNTAVDPLSPNNELQSPATPATNTEQEQSKPQQTTQVDPTMINDILSFFMSDEVFQDGTNAEKAEQILRLLSPAFSASAAEDPTWLEIKKRLEAIKDGISTPPVATTQDIADGEKPGQELLNKADEVATQPDGMETEDNDDANLTAVLNWAKQDPLAKHANIETPEQLQQWLTDLQPPSLDAFIDNADFFTQSIGDAENVVRNLLPPDVYSQKRSGYAKDYDKINNVMLKALKEIVPNAAVGLTKQNIRSTLANLDAARIDAFATKADQIGAMNGLTDISRYTDKIIPSQDNFDSFEQGVSEEALRNFGNESQPMQKQLSTIPILIKLADGIDKVNRNLCDLLDNYIEEHMDDEIPNFPETSVLVREN